MRTINYIVVHCTATNQNATIESILRYWRESLKWKSVGYHYIITPSGEIVNLLPESKVSNGVRGYNSQCINLSYIGGIDSSGSPIDNRTEEQKSAILTLLEQLKERYPNAIIQGHKDFPKVNKACPCFGAKTEYKSI